MTYKPLYTWDSPNVPDHEKVNQLIPYVREYLDTGEYINDEYWNKDVGYSVAHSLAVYLALDEEAQSRVSTTTGSIART